MSSEWRSYRLDEVGRIVTGKTPKGNVAEYVGTDVPFVTPPDFDGSKWINEAARRVSTAGALSVKNNIVPAGSVLVTCIGSDMGKAALTASACVTNQQINAVVVDQEKFCPEFLYYNLSLRKGEIRGLAGGSAQPILNKTAFGQVRFDCPPLAQQKAISAAFGPLDDRITLLRETNATLEAIAQALFKSWFVDFDPVRAKAEGRARQDGERSGQPGMPQASDVPRPGAEAGAEAQGQPEYMDATTAALFPDSFEESELGLVPKGWVVRVLGDIASVKGGKQLGKDFFDDHGLNPIFGGAGVMGHTDLKNAQGFVITVGRVGAYCGQFFWHLGEAWVNNNASHIQPVRNLDAVWIYQWLRATNIDHIKKGAAQPFVSNGDIAELKLALPRTELVDRFFEVAGPIYEQMASLQALAQTLTQFRDTLLPRLISGQLRLPDAESLVEEMSS